MRKYAFLLAAACLAVAPTARAGFVTSLGVTSNLVEPAGWSVGDPLSTHQVWDAKAANTGNLPDQAYDVAGASLTDPTHSVVAPGFRTGTSNFYSFSANYGATADIYNHGTSPSGNGTHVIVQIGSSVNPDQESFPGHGTGTLLDTVAIVDLSDAEITGGANGDALQIAEVAFQSGVSSSFGEVDYQELIFEFWLPGYTGDFRVSWGQMIHATIDTLRVDSIIAAQDIGGGSPFPTTTVPEPSSLALLGIAATALAWFGVKRRRSGA